MINQLNNKVSQRVILIIICFIFLSVSLLAIKLAIISLSEARTIQHKSASGQ